MDRKTIHDFVRAHKIKISCVWEQSNPNMPDWRDADHWKCTLSRAGKRVVVHFSMGRGHGGKEPSAADVLNALALDTSGYENAQSFEDWCGEYGYAADSRKSLKAYKAVEKQAKSLKRFLGEDAFSELLYETEGL